MRTVIGIAMLLVALTSTACNKSRSAQPSSSSSGSARPRPVVSLDDGPAPVALGGLQTACSDKKNALRVYVSGESIEERNRFEDAPFLPSGALNERADESRNDDSEYGWMVPMASRLRLRDPALSLCFVGSTGWTDSNGDAYQGTYPSSVPGMTSAIAGTSISSWLDDGDRERKIPGRRKELTERKHCYDLAFASRGGNDLNNDLSDDQIRQDLVTLIRLLMDGSNCRRDNDPPAVYVTSHLPDRDDVKVQDRVFGKVIREAFDKVRADTTIPQNKRDRLHFADIYGAFRQNRPTRAFPQPRWFSGKFDMKTIGHVGDIAHPRRLASIYAGEVAADALDLGELKGFTTRR